MNDLNRLLEDASRPDDVWSLDRQALVDRGHQRVRRRRWAAAIACAALVAVVATVAVLVPDLGRQDARDIADRPNDGDYVEVRISPTEVERRCTIALNTLLGTDEVWVAGTRDGRAAPVAQTGQSIESREGYGVGLRPEGSRAGRMSVPEDCTIPQEPMLDELAAPDEAEMPEPSDHEAVASWCSRTGGYDVREWSVLAAVEDEDGWINAVVMSGNGYAADCTFGSDSPGLFELHPTRYRDDDGRPILPKGDTGPSDPDRYQRLRPAFSGNSSTTQVAASGTGVIRGLPDDYRITVSLPDGTPLVSTTTDTGGFAYTFVVDPAPKAVRTKVEDADGNLVWEDLIRTGAGYSGGGQP